MLYYFNKKKRRTSPLFLFLFLKTFIFDIYILHHVNVENIKKGMIFMDTKKFRTRQEMKKKQNPKARDYVIGLDVGYSATKVFYEGGYFVFPSYAKKIDDGMINLVNDRDIMYRDDDTGDIYMIGYNAQEMLESTETNDTDGELFSRKRYADKRFRIICDTAIALALHGKNDNRKIVIQTGLPTSYVDGDTAAIQKAVARPVSFSLKTGGGKWRKFELNIKQGDVFVMAQPSGALYSVLIKDDGVYVNNAKQILSSNVLVMDIGFGTFDFYGIKNRAIVCQESIDEIGMKKVFEQTSKKIFSEMHEDIRIAAMQKVLTTGFVECVDDDNMTSEHKPIQNLLEVSNNEIFKDAMDKAKSVTDAFRGYNYLIVDGGTGEAWFEGIKNWLSGMKLLQIMPSNFNDHLPMIYSNARGYYMYRYTLNKR